MKRNRSAAMLPLLAAAGLAGLLIARLARPHHAGSPPDPYEARLLAMGEEAEWRARGAVRRRYAPPPTALGFRPPGRA